MSDRPPVQNSGIDEAGSSVSGPPRGPQLTNLQKTGVAILVTVIVMGFIFLRGGHRATDEQKQPEVKLSAGQSMHPAPLVAPPPPPLPMPDAPAPTLPTPQQHEASPAEAPIMIVSGNTGATAAASPAATAAELPKPSPGQAADEHGLAARLRPTVLQGSKARLLPHPDMLVTKGTMIPCTLQTALDTQLAGFVKCVLPVDVRSTTGNVVLLDKGTTVVGEVQAGLVQGQNRAFVLWDRAETPDHAIIGLDSPGTDELGRAGLPGRVNNHWWQRFGDAILLSVVQGGLQAGTAAASNTGGSNGTTAVFNSFQGNGSQVADTALQNEINIPPTLEKNQGDNINIFVAKDLDFSDVYDLRVRSAAYGQ